MDNGYEMCEYVDEADEPFAGHVVGSVDFVADDDIDEVADIAVETETEVKPVSVSGMLMPLPKRRGRPPKSESEKASVCTVSCVMFIAAFLIICALCNRVGMIYIHDIYIGDICPIFPSSKISDIVDIFIFLRYLLYLSQNI